MEKISLEAQLATGASREQSPESLAVERVLAGLDDPAGLPFVGRKNALAFLKERFQADLGSRTSTSKAKHSVTVMGVMSGTGKTRMLMESHRSGVDHLRVFVTMNRWDSWCEYWCVHCLFVRVNLNCTSATDSQ